MIYFFLIIFLVVICIIDIKDKVIHDGFTLLGCLFALNWQLFHGDIKASVIGMTAGVTIMFLLNAVRIQNVGGGDAKLMAMLGAFTNWQVVLLTGIMAIVLFVPMRRLFYRYDKKTFAYAPYITVAFILVKSCLKI